MKDRKSNVGTKYLDYLYVEALKQLRMKERNAMKAAERWSCMIVE